MLSYYDVAEKKTELQEWYDGYLFGDTEIYNPWSVINYIAKGCRPQAYWANTGKNEILADVLREGQIYIERLVPYDQAGSIARIRKYGQVVQEEFLAEGISVKAYVPMEVYSQI